MRVQLECDCREDGTTMQYYWHFNIDMIERPADTDVCIMYCNTNTVLAQSDTMSKVIPIVLLALWVREQIKEGTITRKWLEFYNNISWLHSLCSLYAIVDVIKTAWLRELINTCSWCNTARTTYLLHIRLATRQDDVFLEFFTKCIS